MAGTYPDQVKAPPSAQLPPITDETRAIVRDAEARRLALMGDQQALRERYIEVMRWINPPWDPVSRRIDPRSERATAARQGEPVWHADLVSQVIRRWAVLETGEKFIFRVKPKPVYPPVDTGDQTELVSARKLYDLERAEAQAQSSQMEDQTNDWMEDNNLHRTLYWAAFCKRAFGKAILKSGWDPAAKMPTVELLENPSQVYYAWTKRYGRRKLAWALVIDQMAPEEAEARFGITMPRDAWGNLNLAQWTGVLDESEMDQRPEQSQEVQRYVYAEESWELAPDGVRYALIVAGRVVEGPWTYPWKRLPFHVLEQDHIVTYPHGKSTAEAMIPISEAYDDLMDRQQAVIEFESGPRYIGPGMEGRDEVEIPDVFEFLPLPPDADIRQLDTRVDFFPSQLHAAELKDAKYKVTGLTPVAWGMSPNAQTSGRALSAEWKAVELPLLGSLIDMSPEVKELLQSWWDYAEEYVDDARALAAGYRRFEVLWQPFDIRDKTEKTLDIIQRLQANLVDPETAIEETGYQNTDEIMAKIKAYLMDPIYNPLRYQQYLTLQQLELAIRQQELEVAMMEAQAGMATEQAAPGVGPGGPPPDQLAAQGANAAAQAAQGPGGPVTEANNQPGGIPVDTSILSQTPLVGGIGNRAIVPLGGGPTAPPSNGQVPQ